MVESVARLGQSRRPVLFADDGSDTRWWRQAEPHVVVFVDDVIPFGRPEERARIRPGLPRPGQLSRRRHQLPTLADGRHVKHFLPDAATAGSEPIYAAKTPLLLAQRRKYDHEQPQFCRSRK